MKDGLELGKKLKERNLKSMQRIKRKNPSIPLPWTKLSQVGWVWGLVCLLNVGFFLLLRWLLYEKGEGLEMGQMFSTQGWAHRSVKSHLSTLRITNQYCLQNIHILWLRIGN